MYSYVVSYFAFLQFSDVLLTLILGEQGCLSLKLLKKVTFAEHMFKNSTCNGDFRLMP